MSPAAAPPASGAPAAAPGAVVPSGREIRRVTASIQGARAGRGVLGVILELWYAAITIALLAAVVVGFAGAVRGGELVTAAEAGTDAAARAALLGGGDLAVVLVLLAVVGGVLAVAGRLGPVAVGGGGGAWWLPLPVDRRGLLRATVLAWPGTGAVAGGLAVPLGMVLLGLPVSAGRVLGWTALGAGAAALATALAALAQTHRARLGGPDPSRRVAVVGEVTVLAAVVGLAVLGLVGGGGTWRGEAAWLADGGPLGVLGAVAVAGAVVVTLAAERRTDRVPGARLRSLGSIADRSRAAVLSLDLRELGRALTLQSAGRRRRRVRHVGPGAARALVIADLLLLARSPRAPVQVGLAALVAAAATRMDLLGPGLGLHLVLVLTGYWAATAAAGGARHGDLAPVLDRLLPLSARAVRVLRGAVPLLAALVWAAVALGAVALARGDAAWLLLAPAWAAVLAAAAVRGAYRPGQNWARAAVTTPMGAAPPISGFTQGPDVVLVGTVPSAVAFYVGAAPAGVLLAQAAVATVLLAGLVATVGRRPSPARTRPRAPETAPAATP